MFDVTIHASARRHGVYDEDIRHVVEHGLVADQIGEDPDRWVVIGPNRAGHLLEVIVLVTIEGTELAIHAMPMRTIYRRLLGP